MPKTRTKPRWRHDMLILDNSIVGMVENPHGKQWWAYGCAVDWQDIRLGTHEKLADAKRAVEVWVEEHRED